MNPAVDAYIAKAQPFARPILEKIRAAFHAGCPNLEEKIKWGCPSFEHKGMLGGMAAFKAHVGFGFWKSALMGVRGVGHRGQARGHARQAPRHRRRVDGRGQGPQLEVPVADRGPACQRKVRV